MNTKEEEKELVWLPKSLVKKIKALENTDNFVLQYIEESKRDIKQNFDTLDDEIIQYKANMIKARKEFHEAKEEMLNANYELWEKFDKERKGLYELSNKMKESLEPLKDELEQIKSLMESIDRWAIKDLLNMIHEINDKISYGETKNILKFVINNYKKGGE